MSILIFSIVGLLMVPGNAESHASSTSEGWYAVGSSGEVFKPKDSKIMETEPDSGTVKPMLLGVDDWTQCWVFNNETHPITGYDFSWDGEYKRISLQCGNEKTQGYHHIRFRHESEWRGRITEVSKENTDTWDDLMSFANQEGLKAPAYSSGPRDGKLCVSPKIDMYSDPTHYVYTFYPTVSVSLTNDRIVTSYPTTRSDCR
jgi:hypothetical protein